MVHECPFIVIETEGGSLDVHEAFIRSWLAVWEVNAGDIKWQNEGCFGLI